MKKSHLYILGGFAVAVVAVLALRHRMQRAAGTSSTRAVALTNWRLPWEVANTEEGSLANSLRAALRNATGFTPGTVTDAPPIP